MRALRDAEDATGFSRGLWKQFAEMGFTGILVEEAHGGLGLGQVEAGIVLEEIGRNLTLSPFLSTSVGAVTALKSGAAAQAERWLPGIVAGEVVAALAIDEGTHHRPLRTALKAERSGNGFTLSGDKRFVAHGHYGGPADRRRPHRRRAWRGGRRSPCSPWRKMRARPHRYARAAGRRQPGLTPHLRRRAGGCGRGDRRGGRRLGYPLTDFGHSAHRGCGRDGRGQRRRHGL